MFEPALIEANWRRFRVRLWEETNFREVVGEPFRDFDRVDKACRICWQVHSDDVAQVLRNMKELNLRSLKQVSVLRDELTKLGRCGDPASKCEKIGSEIAVEFCEPLRHVDSVTRDLVLAILGDKVRQIHSANPPAYLIRALAEAGTVDFDGWREKFELARQRAQTAEENNCKLEQHLKDASDEVSQLQDQLVTKDQHLRSMEQELKGVQERERLLQKKVAKLVDDLASAHKSIQRLEKDSDKWQEKVQKLFEENRCVKEELAHVSARLKVAQEEIVQRLSRIESLEIAAREAQQLLQTIEKRFQEAQKRIDDLLKRCEDLRNTVALANARAKALEEENKELQTELAFYKGKKTAMVSTQTMLQGKHIDEQAGEQLRLKNDLGELRSKVTDLCAELQRKGIEDLIQQVGLEKLMKPPACYERLHKDAELRATRLEKMQDKASEERLSHFALHKQEDVTCQVGGTLEASLATPPRAENEVVNGTEEQNSARDMEHILTVDETVVGFSVDQRTDGEISHLSPRLPPIVATRRNNGPENMSPSWGFARSCRPSECRRHGPSPRRSHSLQVDSLGECRGRAAGPMDLWPPGASRRGIVGAVGWG
eukprot:TRINITY_DN60750_c0_g1_i1.p1 TRINITY_DN60750_c0_g1~~TRINITY_DN60750_c0_g1_i1.p1  ORF type:complete len:600 (-),score=101.45 TRINITY_DN60750_c0_g1_i1:156-1955(-)